jgi:GNAT superfamily N-acetyltransferase
MSPLLANRAERDQWHQLKLRRATALDALSLANLSFRSKAYWGYDAAFMERIRPVLEPQPEYLQTSPVFVLERNSSEPIAFYGFKTIEGNVFLHDFFVAPEMIGRGIGSRLWNLALETAREQQYKSFLIESDPFAKGFYQHMGAYQVGEIKTIGTGRMLPLLRYNLQS